MKKGKDGKRTKRLLLIQYDKGGTKIVAVGRGDKVQIIINELCITLQ